MNVAIIGGGVAGLTAARVLAEHGVRVSLFEASGRLGGRARTIYDAGTPVELGPEFVHGSADPTRALAREAGVPLDAIRDRHHWWRDGRLVDAGDVWARFGAILEPAEQLDHDMSAREFSARARLSADDARLFAAFVEGFYGASLDEISITSIAGDASGPSGESDQFRVRGGYGALVEFLVARCLAAGVVVHRNMVVRRVDWSGPGVRLALVHGGVATSALADRVIVTVPIGVLQRGELAFFPPLDRDVAGAIDRFAMGQVVKVVIRVAEPIWRWYTPSGVAFVHRDDGPFPTFWLGDDQIIAWAGGAHARALATLVRTGSSPPAALDPESTLAQIAIAGFARAIGMPPPNLARAVTAAYHHDYANDPFAYGAYSYTRVGGATAATILARPIAGRVVFAGEATDVELEGTVAGALASGRRAAHQVLATTRTRMPARIAAPHGG